MGVGGADSRGGRRPTWSGDKELGGDWRNGVVTTNHPSALRRGPPLLAKEGSAKLRNCSYFPD